MNAHTPHSKHNTNALASMHNMYHSSGSNTLQKNSVHNKDFTTLDTPTKHTTNTTATASANNTNNTNNDMLKTSFKNQARRPSVELAVIPPFSNKVHTNNTNTTTVGNGVSGKHASGVSKQTTATTAASSTANSTSSTSHTTTSSNTTNTNKHTDPATNTSANNPTTTIYTHGSTTNIHGSSVPVYNTNGVVYVKGGYNNDTSSSQGAGSLEELTLLD